MCEVFQNELHTEFILKRWFLLTEKSFLWIAGIIGGTWLAKNKSIHCDERQAGEGGTMCQRPLPVWVAAAKESGLEEGMAAICDSQNGISTTNLKTLNLNFEINCD